MLSSCLLSKLTGVRYSFLTSQQADSTDTASEGYYSDADSDLTSLASSVTNYVYENGRRYHAYRAVSLIDAALSFINMSDVATGKICVRVLLNAILNME